MSVAASDGNAAEEGRDPGTLRVSRSGSTVGALTVNYTIATGLGQATAADYTPSLSGVVTINAGQPFADITVVPVDDALFEGPETLTVTLFDSGSYDVGSPASATVTIADNDPPDTAIDSAPGTLTTSTSARFAFGGSEPVSAISRFECSLDGSNFETCSSPVTYLGLADGVHSFLVRAVDIAGNADPTPASVTWTVDTTAPTITVSASAPVLWPPNGKLVPDTISGSIADSLSGVDPATITFRVVDSYGTVQPAGPVSLGTDGEFAFAVSLEAARMGQSGDGRRYEIIVTASDNAGNRSSASTTVIVPHDSRK